MTRRKASVISVIITAIVTVLLYGGQQFLTQHPINSPIAQPSQNNTAITPGFYKVTHVTDGDTINVDMNGTEETVRFIGVDTPETHKPNTPVQCYGPEASDFTHKILGGKAVRLEADPTNDNRDRYGRLLRYVYLQDGTLLQKSLIAQGYGFAYTSFPFQKKDEFVQAQSDAQAGEKGLWGACKPFQTSGGRWQSPTK